MALQVPDLVYRLVKGSALTATEHDSNLEKIRDFLNTAVQIIESSLKENGDLKDNTVSADSLRDRIITQEHLAWVYAHFARDNGSADDYQISISPYPAAYAEGMFFLVKFASGNTGPSQIRLAASASTWLDRKPLRKRGNLELESGDIRAGQIAACVYDEEFGVVQIIAMLGGSSAENNTTNFTGVTQYQPDSVVLPGANAASSFSHGLNQIPQHVSAVLHCIDADIDYLVGQEVPISDFCDADGEPAFTLVVDADTIEVTQHLAAPLVPDLTTGAPTAITSAKWKLRVSADKIFNSNDVPIFPATSLVTRNPEGCLGYGDNVFVWNYGGDTTRICALNLVNRNLNYIATVANDTYVNPALFKLSDGTVHAFYISGLGWTKLLLSSPYTRNLLQASANYTHKPVWVDDSGSTSNPNVYAIQSRYGIGNVSSLGMLKIIYSGTYAAPAAHGSAIDLRNAGIINVTAFQNLTNANMLINGVCYNPHDDKRRLYVWLNTVGAVAIFNIQAFASNDLSAWWTDAGRYAALEYEKCIFLDGGGYPADTAKFTFAVDYDVDTGEERAVVFNDFGYNSNIGHAVRVPWNE